MVSLGGQAPHVRPMGRTCGEPNEIGLTPIGVVPNGSGRVLVCGVHAVAEVGDVAVRPEARNHGLRLGRDDVVVSVQRARVQVALQRLAQLKDNAIHRMALNS